MARKVARLVLLGFFLAGAGLPLSADRMGYPPSEFVARRQALAARLKQGTVVLFGATMPSIAGRFRQDNDFFYFTGNEDVNAVMVMDAATAAAWLFLPTQTPGEIKSDGRNGLTEADAATRWGYVRIQPLGTLNEFLARRRTFGPQALWMRLSEADEVSQGRTNKAQNLARRFGNPLVGGQPSEDAFRVEAIRSRFPYFELKDVVPEVDRMRVIKTPREIEILTHNGRINAEAFRRAISITRPGMFEYEIEAEAAHYLLKNGIQGNGFGAIVGSGANGNQLHYRTNGKRMAAGELVVMDYGGALDYEVIDITRTWPVSGRFDELQLRAYRCALEAGKAIIALMRPGATRAQTREAARAIYQKYGFEGSSSAGHFVGMSVHDVGDSSLPFAAGMVIAVEPMVDLPEKQLHVRVEDSVLVTDGEPVVLTAWCPKEVDELLALLVPKAAERSARLSQTVQRGIR